MIFRSLNYPLILNKKIQPILSGFLNYFIGNDIIFSVDGVIKVKALGLSKEIEVEKVF